jgi:hypothetical protein
LVLHTYLVYNTLVYNFLVNRSSQNGNGYHLYLKNTYKSTNQRKNSIQNAPTRTKLGKPKMDPTMVILAAFSILLTHICFDLCLMPQGQIRGSNAFSLDRELQFCGRHEINISLSECWHTTHTIHTTISAASLQNRSRKQVQYKSISHSEINMPTNRAIPVSSTCAISGDVPEETDSAFSSNGEKEPIDHAPPRLPPTRTGKKPPTKTQLLAERKANKELKIKSAEEKAEGKTSPHCSRKPTATSYFHHGVANSLPDCTTLCTSNGYTGTLSYTIKVRTTYQYQSIRR